MTLQELAQRIDQQKNFLCVGLDPLLDRIPLSQGRSSLEAMEHFLQRVIDRTRSHCVAGALCPRIF